MHFAGAYNRASRARQLAVSDDSSTLFHPSGSVVQASAEPSWCHPAARTSAGWLAGWLTGWFWDVCAHKPGLTPAAYGLLICRSACYALGCPTCPPCLPVYLAALLNSWLV